MIKAENLTIEEKLRLICARDYWFTVELEGKLPNIRMTDGPNGIRMPLDATKWDGNSPSVAYPSLQVLANTWSRECAREMGEALADDCKDFGADILLGPGVNIKRSPLCGRNYEYFSEDPYLTGMLACDYIEGLQQNGVGACVKHFCGNNLENNRMEQTSEIDERTLRELYYKPFELALKAEPVSVMCSYNRINGIYASEYEKGFRVLRDEYGFQGAVISDWRAVRDRSLAAEAGLDLEMPFDETHYQRLREDYEAGRLSGEALDACAQHVIDLVYRCRQLREKTQKKSKYTVDERIALTQKIEEEGIVLLKNNGVLPLKKGQSLSMCGLYARPCAYAAKHPGLVAGGGSGQVERLTSMFDMVEIMEREHGGPVLYEPAFKDDGVDWSFMKPGLAVEHAAECDVNIVFAGTGASIEHEGCDRSTMSWKDTAAAQTILDTAAVNPNTVVVVFAGAPIDMRDWIDHVAAVVYVGFPGERGGEAIANVLTGRVNPSGKLTETFPLSYEDTPAASCYKNSLVTRYDEGLDVGYRYYDTHGVEVLFPFGHGLSYSEFRYQNLSLTPEEDTKLRVSYEIENISDMAGKEVSQVYVRPCAPHVYRPCKELKGFSKELVEAGERVRVTVELEKEAFAYWSTATDSWIVEDGVYEILTGASCKDIRLSGKIKIVDGQVTVIQGV